MLNDLAILKNIIKKLPLDTQEIQNLIEQIDSLIEVRKLEIKENITINHLSGDALKNITDVMFTLNTEVEKLKEIITQVHSWIVCSSIATPEDMMKNADWIEDITNLKTNMLYNKEEIKTK